MKGIKKFYRYIHNQIFDQPLAKMAFDQDDQLKWFGLYFQLQLM